ncbi:MAG: YdbL family protein [Pseudomonadota bacterium]
MTVFRYIVILAVSALAALSVTALTQTADAQGAEIDAAKSAGVVGERIDGYLGIVENGGVDSSLRRRVNEINARRRAAYDEVASSAGATTAQVARITGEKQIARVSPGEFYMDENGRWVRKAQ